MFGQPGTLKKDEEGICLTIIFIDCSQNKQPLLTHSAREYFEKLVFKKNNQKKNATLNGCISKARANSEFKLTFSESPFHFLQNSVVFSLSNSNNFTTAKKCRRESCIIDFTSAKMEFTSAIFKTLYFSKYSIKRCCK